MATKTDPAKEIADFCKKLSATSNKAGDRHAADMFGVDPWSREFLEILTCFVERTEFLLSLIETLEFDDDQRGDHRKQIKRIQTLASRDLLARRWDEAGGGGQLMRGTEVASIGPLSSYIRQHVSYPLLSDKERSELVEEIDTLQSWLVENELSEQDFIRQALIEGLKTFRRRLDHAQWLGWDHTFKGMKEVIAAYMALERRFPDPNVNPTAEAVMKGTRKLFKKFWVVTGTADEVRTRMDLAVTMYGYYHLAKPVVAGLLPGE